MRLVAAALHAAGDELTRSWLVEAVNAACMQTADDLARVRGLVQVLADDGDSDVRAGAGRLMHVLDHGG